jgi:aminomethyltransferase
VTIGGTRVLAARTGYTGEPVCFELFVPSAAAGTLWEALAARGAWPVGLGARDTLRLEAGLPLYGHELGLDEEGREMAIFASAVARRAVSFAAAKGDFVGREALLRQREELTRLRGREVTASDVLPRLIVPIAVAGRRAARAGARVLSGEGRDVGRVTSGTIVPYWKTRGAGPATAFSGETGMRAIGLALVDSRLAMGERIRIDIRGREACGRIVGGHLRTAPPPFARPVVHEVSEDCVAD